MKFIKNNFTCFFIITFLSSNILCSASSDTIFPNQPLNLTTNPDGTAVTPDQMDQYVQQYKDLKTCVTSYTTTAVITDDDGNSSVQVIPQMRTTQSAPPSALKDGLRGGKFSLFKLSGDPAAPSGSSLFSLGSSSTVTAQAVSDEDDSSDADSSGVSLGSIASQFDSLMSLIASEPDFVQFFRKIHLNILNELYEYLINIYTNFNLQHPGSTTTSSGSFSISVPDFLSAQEQYAINKKTLIVMMLVNLIEEQFNSAIIALQPSVPQLLATKLGKTSIMSDYSIDLTNFIVQDIEDDLENMRSIYLNALNKYLLFFQNYTSLISVNDDSTGFSQFCTVAENINNTIGSVESDTTVQDAYTQKYASGTQPASLSSLPANQIIVPTSSSSSVSSTAVANIQMNPAMFFYDEETMRSLRIIPDLAKKIPTGVSSIGWPQTLVDAATNQTLVVTSSSTHPVAYFFDADNNLTTNPDLAAHLYACIQSGSNYFQEEVLKQPDWLNTEEGILNILRACLGDFTALIGMGILDCCMETLIKNGLNPTQSSSDDIATQCDALIDTWTEKINAQDDDDTTSDTTTSDPSLSDQSDSFLDSLPTGIQV